MNGTTTGGAESRVLSKLRVQYLDYLFHAKDKRSAKNS